MTPSTHKVRVQRLQVTAPPGIAGVLLQQRLTSVWQDVGTPIVESVFDAHDPGSAVLEYDRLVVDLGVVTLEGLADAIRARLPEALGAALARVPGALQGHAPSIPGEGFAAAEAPTDAGAPWVEDLSAAWGEAAPRPGPAGVQDKARDSAASQPRRVEAGDRVCEALQEFLRTGSLPWWFTLPAAGLAAALEESVATAPAFRLWLAHVLATDRRVLRRLALQFDAPVLHAVAVQLASPGAVDLRPVPSPAATSAARVRAWEEVLLRLARAHTGRGPRADAAAVGQPGPASMRPRPSSAEEPTGSAATDPVAVEPLGPAADAAAAAPPGAAAPPAITPPAARGASATERPGTAAADVDLRVDNAGLVVVAAFVPELFARCHLLAGARFADRTCQEVGVHALEYLVSGRQGHPEHQLALDKVLCGVDLLQPVPADLELPPAVVEECDALLAAVIRHWTVLGRTSVRGLREAFLQRPGRLCGEPAAWVVRVERRGLDVLVDRIPWTISMFRAPWMERPLRVEW